MNSRKRKGMAGKPTSGDPVLRQARTRRAQIPARVGESGETSVMTPLNPQWDRFARRLARAIRAEGCDAETLRLSGRLLAGMGCIDVGKSLAYFRANDGYCDCEVLMNVSWRGGGTRGTVPGRNRTRGIGFAGRLYNS